jgi:DNA-binding transcriptional ArsR family regulator
MNRLFEVLAEPNRRRILELLAAGELSVSDLVSGLALSQPAVSKHLKVLRDAELVTVRVDGQRRLYRVDPEPLRALDDWLAPYRAQWGRRLDDLERHLDQLASAGAPDKESDSD